MRDRVEGDRGREDELWEEESGEEEVEGDYVVH